MDDRKFERILTGLVVVIAVIFIATMIAFGFAVIGE
ncbi:hypothetical protein LCGC14_2193210 [marine sediment metagenome]|uniref:Uncharacterized protein n=1 Tax=marine sediment metagenome TaxID=412755 RepID=A0A0F9DJ10_9ZZZZ